MPKKEREIPNTWSYPLEFLLSCIGYAIGVGNVWRFPDLCMKNGGGAFLIPYFVFLCMAGIPLFYLELALGQFTSLSPISVWNISPIFKGIGLAMCTTSFVCCVYYNSILDWTFYYLYHSFTTGPLPWTTCDNAWNTEFCSVRKNRSQSLLEAMNSTLKPVLGNLTTGFAKSNYSIVTMEDTVLNKTFTPAEEFWNLNCLSKSDGIETMGTIKWELVICHFVSWTVATLCLIKGVKSLGKVVYVTATLPYVLLTVLLIRGVTLPGSLNGIMMYIKPDFNKLANFQIWAEACIQVFYSLGPTWGGLITMASYNKFNANCRRYAVIVPLLNAFTSIFAGFVVFSIVGFMAHEAGLPVDKVVSSGIGLAFIVYPEALSLLPLPPLWAICFFIMLITLGLDTQFGMLETITSGICEKFQIKGKMRYVALFGIHGLAFIIGLVYCTQGAIYYFQITDWYMAAITNMLIAVLEGVIISWVYGSLNFSRDIAMMTGSQPSLVMRFMWAVFIPLLMTVMLLYSLIKFQSPTYGDYIYPHWIGWLGWSIAAVSAIPIPIYALVEVSRSRGSLQQRCYKLLKPTSDWGPVQPEFRLEYDLRMRRKRPSCNLADFTMTLSQCEDSEDFNMNECNKDAFIVAV